MKIIITGATGSLGAFLTRYFSQQGHEIIATGTVQNPPKVLLKFAEYMQVDIRKPFQLPKADLCIHATAKSDDIGAKKDFLLANVTGTENVVKASAACQRFIHISSSSVYLPSNKLLKEEMAGKQNNNLLSFYGESKLMAEEVINKSKLHSTYFILRPRMLYGVGDKMIIPRSLHLVKNNKLNCPGKMEINISMTHYTNFGHAIDCCINSDKKGINIYNVSDEIAYVLKDIMRKIIIMVYGRSLPVKNIPIILLKLLAQLQLGGMSKLLIRTLTQDMVLDISKIKRELNYQPITDFDSSQQEISEWIKRIGGPEVIKAGEKRLAWEL
jgi:nucleoside-diphosphate-sugar epimerase